jgi:hypothetical protein
LSFSCGRANGRLLILKRGRFRWDGANPLLFATSFCRRLAAAHDLVLDEPIIVGGLRPVFDAGHHDEGRASLVLARTRFLSLAAALLRDVVPDQQDAVRKLNVRGGVDLVASAAACGRSRLREALL